MTRTDKTIFGILLGSIIPISLFLAVWWSTYHNPRTFHFAFISLCIGILLDYAFLPGWIRKCFNLQKWMLTGIYLFYSIGMFGFFMGIPIFHPLLGIIAGYYFGKRLFYNKTPLSEASHISRNVAMFTSSITLLICTVSAFIALWNEGAAKELQRMLDLQSKPSCETIIAIILIGGASLIFTTYIVTRLAIAKTIRIMQTSLPKP